MAFQREMQCIVFAAIVGGCGTQHVIVRNALADAIRMHFPAPLRFDASVREGGTSGTLRALDDPEVTRWGDSHCVIEYSDDYQLHRNMVVVVHFDKEDKIKSENTYWRGPNPHVVNAPTIAGGNTGY